MSDLQQRVLDRLEDTGIFWNLQDELRPLIVESMNAATLITGEPQFRASSTLFTIPANPNPTGFVPLVLPVDAVVAEGLDSAQGRAVGIREIPAGQMGLDVGPRTVERFTKALSGARTIVWNGPMGVFERPPFAAGTLALARAVASSPAFTVIGGGDTVAAVTQAGVAEQIGYISTAGGAFLEFLEGRKLPGVEALTDAT